MGIVFGKRKNHVKVLTIKETQSLPEIHIQRKFGRSEEAGPTRSMSYQTTLPNLISSDDDSGDGMPPVPVPPPFSVPSITHGTSMTTRGITMVTRDVSMALPGIPMSRQRLSPGPTVVAELSSSAEEYSCCHGNEQYSCCHGNEELSLQIQRQSTVLLKEIVGRREGKQLSSRESYRKALSSRGSYRKTCLKSRKRQRKNSYLTESSLSKSDASWASDNSLTRSGDETQSDAKALIHDKQTCRNTAGCKISRKSTLNSALRFNSSSDEGLVDYSLKRQLNKNDRRTRRDRITSRGQLLINVAGVITEKVKSKRVNSAWDGGGRKAKHQLLESGDASYDASSERSTSESDDELNYSTRRKTNPFLGGTRVRASFYRRRQVAEYPTSKPPFNPNLVNILPNYAKSSYSSNNYSSNNYAKSSYSSNKQHSSARETNTIQLPACVCVSPFCASRDVSMAPRDVTMGSRDVTMGSRDVTMGSRDVTMTTINAATTTHKHRRRERNSSVQIIEGVRRPRTRRKQHDGFDELDCAVDMLNMIL